MTQVMRHRGPDDEGYALVGSNGASVALRGADTISELNTLPSVEEYQEAPPYFLGFGHRRLSILDVTARGHQPMQDPDAGLWLVFNGEIYNYIEIRNILIGKGFVFRTDTDTEVILKAYRCWGPDCLQYFNGIWAFALWDAKKQLLFCARDRFGVKPFYYSQTAGQFAFASEIKALLKHSRVSPRVNNAILWDYLALTLIDHTDETFFDGISQLRPGHFITIDREQLVRVKQYYRLQCNDEIGSFNSEELDGLAGQFVELLADAVKIRLRSDVPVGSYLSGGIDSSTILRLAERFTPGLSYAFRTFSAVYDDHRYDERPYIKDALEGTSASPHFYTAHPDMLRDDLEDLIYYQEEPFISTAIYAQWSLLKNIRKDGLKVLLTGDGADEVLCGYPYPYLALFLLGLLREGRYGRFGAELSSMGIVPGITHTIKGLYWLLPSMARVPIRKRFRLKPNIMRKDFWNEYLWREKLWMDALFRTSVQNRLYQDMTTFLLPHELRFREKNAMAFSIEERQPFLDYRLVEMCFAAKASYKIHNGWRKYLLRHAVQSIVPESIRWRKQKLGFGSYELRWFLDTISWQGLSTSGTDKYFSRNALEECRTRLSPDNTEQAIEIWAFYNTSLWMKSFGVAS